MKRTTRVRIVFNRLRRRARRQGIESTVAWCSLCMCAMILCKGCGGNTCGGSERCSRCTRAYAEWAALTNMPEFYKLQRLTAIDDHFVRLPSGRFERWNRERWRLQR